MNIDDIADDNARFCKETGKQIIDGKCVCSGKPAEEQCKCQTKCHDIIDLRKLAPFLIYLSKFYKGPNKIITE